VFNVVSEGLIHMKSGVSMQILLSQLSQDHLNLHNCWRVVEKTAGETDVSLEPALLNDIGQIDSKQGEVWCLCEAILANGKMISAVAMCRADSDDEPLLWSFFINSKFVSLRLPPAPDFVLMEEGPTRLSEAIGLAMKEVFPLTLSVVSQFHAAPRTRSIVIHSDKYVLS